MDALSSKIRVVAALRITPTPKAIADLGGVENCKKTVEKTILSEVADIIELRQGEVIDGNLTKGLVVHFPSNTVAVCAALDLLALLQDRWERLFQLQAGIQSADLDGNGKPFRIDSTDASDIDLAVSLMSAASYGQVLMTRGVHNNARIGILAENTNATNGSKSLSATQEFEFRKIGVCECDIVEGQFTVFEVRGTTSAPRVDPSFSKSLQLAASRSDELVDEGGVADTKTVFDAYLEFQQFLDNVHFEELLGEPPTEGEEDRSSRVNAVLRLSLVAATKVISTIASSQILCSIKVKKSARKFACIYPPQSGFFELQQALNELNSSQRYSYSGRALHGNKLVMVPDFSVIPEKELPWPTSIKSLVKKHKIKGVIACPIRVTLSDGCKPRGVFKVDLFEPEAIRADNLSVSLIEMVANQIGLVWQREALVFQRQSAL